MIRIALTIGLAVSAVPAASPVAAQSFPTPDPVIRRMGTEGMEQPSQAYRLAQTLMDSIGPRLTGSPGHQGAV
jgi:hypothetical protein